MEKMSYVGSIGFLNNLFMIRFSLIVRGKDDCRVMPEDGGCEEEAPDLMNVKCGRGRDLYEEII